MRIRLYNPETDLKALQAMHAAQGFDYVFPNLDHPEFFCRFVAEDEEGQPIMAIMGRLTAEMYLLMDPHAGSGATRLQGFLRLHQASEADMATKGIQDCYAQIPPGPRMEKFKRLLALLGWKRADTWEPWTKPQLYLFPRLTGAIRALLGRGNDGTERAGPGSGHEPKGIRHTDSIHF